MHAPHASIPDLSHYLRHAGHESFHRRTQREDYLGQMMPLSSPSDKNIKKLRQSPGCFGLTYVVKEHRYKKKTCI